MDFYGTNCLVPGCQSDPMDRTIDHVIPLSKGGANGLWNLQPLCKSHNSAKQARHDTDYRSTKWVERINSKDVIYTPYVVKSDQVPIE